MSLLKSTHCFPAGNKTDATATRWTGALPVSLANSVPPPWQCWLHCDYLSYGGTSLLSDTQINIREHRYIISLKLAVIRRQEQRVVKSQPTFNHPANQLTSAVSYSTGATMSWLWRITWKTNISHPSQFIHLDVPKLLPPSGVLRSAYLYFVKDVSGKHIGPILKGQAAQE